MFIKVLRTLNPPEPVNHKAVRGDLSEWVIHFVHDRKLESEISSLQEFFESGYTGEYKHPDYFNPSGDGQCIFFI